MRDDAYKEGEELCESALNRVIELLMQTAYRMERGLLEFENYVKSVEIKDEYEEYWHRCMEVLLEGGDCEAIIEVGTNTYWASQKKQKRLFYLILKGIEEMVSSLDWISTYKLSLILESLLPNDKKSIVDIWDNKVGKSYLNELHERAQNKLVALPVKITDEEVLKAVDRFRAVFASMTEQEIVMNMITMTGNRQLIILMLLTPEERNIFVKKLGESGIRMEVEMADAITIQSDGSCISSVNKTSYLSSIDDFMSWKEEVIDS